MPALSIEAPTVAEYARNLPDGWESFPSCQAKAALIRGAASDPRLGTIELPEPVRALVDDPPPVTAWVPEVFHVALTLAVLEAFAHEGRVGEFLEWIAQRNRELFGGASYAPMMKGAAAERLLKTLPSGWERFHRGTELMIDSLEAEAATILLSSPPGLYPGVASQMHGTSLRVALETAGAREVTVHHRLHRPGLAAYELTWTS